MAKQGVKPGLFSSRVYALDHYTGYLLYEVVVGLNNLIYVNLWEQSLGRDKLYITCCYCIIIIIIITLQLLSCLSFQE